MIHFLANRLTVFLQKNEVIQQDLPVYQYGLELAISFILGMVLVMLEAALFQDVLSGIIFLCSFYILRSFTGGFHCSTYFRCNLLMVCVFTGCILLLKLPDETMVSLGVSLISFLGVIYIGKYAPIDHANKRLTVQEKTRNHILAISTAIVMFAGAAIMQHMHIKYHLVFHYILIATASLLLVSKRMEEKREKFTT